MESLVSMAKRLGIRPNPKMTQKERKQVAERIAEYIRKKVPLRYQHRINGKLSEIDDAFYTLCKKVDRKISNPGQLKKNYDFFLKKTLGIRQKTQDEAFFYHIDEKRIIPTHERFVADIQLDSPLFPEMVKKLDSFIKKYHAAFKITNEEHKDRTDTLNMYLPYDITPQMAQEFVQIIRPCLSEKYDDFLNGSPLTQNGKIIKGVRTGPEYSSKTSQNTPENNKRITKETGTWISTVELDSDSSLGQKVANVEALDLAYYLAGKEGQNPFQLLSYDGKPYRKSLEIGTGARAVSKAPVDHPKSVPVVKKSPVTTPIRKVPAVPVRPIPKRTALKPATTSATPKTSDFQSLLKQLSQEITGLRKEVRACHRDISGLRAYQAETRRHLGKA